MAEAIKIKLYIKRKRKSIRWKQEVNFKIIMVCSVEYGADLSLSRLGIPVIQKKMYTAHHELDISEQKAYT